MEELKKFFSSILLNWLIVIDFNGMIFHEFLVLLNQNAQALLLYASRLLGLMLIL